MRSSSRCSGLGRPASRRCASRPWSGTVATSRRTTASARCWGCTRGCSKLVTVTEGPYAGYSGEEPEYEGMASMASQIGVTDAGAAVMLANECDSLGFDVNELGWLLGWVMECFERGLLT